MLLPMWSLSKTMDCVGGSSWGHSIYWQVFKIETFKRINQKRRGKNAFTKYRCANVIATTGSAHANTTLLAATTGTRASSGRTMSTTVLVTKSAKHSRKNSRRPPTFATRFGTSPSWWPTPTASHSNHLQL